MGKEKKRKLTKSSSVKETTKASPDEEKVNTTQSTSTPSDTCYTCQGKGCIICEFGENPATNKLQTALPISTPSKTSLQCPVCNGNFIMDERDMDKHVEECLTNSALAEEAKHNTPVVIVPEEKKKVMTTTPRKKYYEDSEEEDEDEEEERELEENFCENCGADLDDMSSTCSSCTPPKLKVPKKLPTNTPPMPTYSFGAVMNNSYHKVPPPPMYSPSPTPSFGPPSTISSVSTLSNVPYYSSFGPSFGSPKPSSHNYFMPPIPTENRCPYTMCAFNVPRTNFVDHVLKYHKNNKDQAYLCPLCVSPEMPVYHVNKKTNLYQHVQMAHSLSPVTFSAPPEVPTPPKKEVQINLIEEVLTKTLDQECSICYEDLQLNQKIARLECLCVFHAECIHRWFEKQKRCPLHENLNSVEEDDVQVVS